MNDRTPIPTDKDSLFEIVGVSETKLGIESITCDRLNSVNEPYTSAIIFFHGTSNPVLGGVDTIAHLRVS